MAGIDSVDIKISAEVPQKKVKDDVLPTVRHVFAVASGKGGVGKSTVSVNLACALAATGAKVGLMDADIYGPSIPMMMGVNREPYVANKKMIPIEQHGVRLVSMGFLVDPKAAMIWRGPMLMGAVKQFITDVAWGDLDYLLVDLPPGTGDVQMTLAQTVPLQGAVVVSTPQNIALLDAQRGVTMFQKLGVPILGLVENMSQFVCPECNTVTPFSGAVVLRATPTARTSPSWAAFPSNQRCANAATAAAPWWWRIRTAKVPAPSPTSPNR